MQILRGPTLIIASKHAITLLSLWEDHIRCGCVGHGCVVGAGEEGGAEESSGGGVKGGVGGFGDEHL